MQRLEKRYNGFQEISFVLRAAAKDKTKPIFTCLYVELNEKGEKVFVCTDSKRLNLFVDSEGYFSEWEVGFYEIIKNTKSEIVLNHTECEYQFPNYKQIIPQESKVFAVFNCRANIQISKFYQGFYETFSGKSIGMNNDFLNDALIDGEIVNCSTNENMNYCCMSPILFNYENNCKALVMPIQLKKD
jgi:DNA polymerase III sliding clamp (beta) subunit (PCNA family)